MRHEVAGHAVVRIVKKNLHALLITRLRSIRKRTLHRTNSIPRPCEPDSLKKVEESLCAVSHIELYNSPRETLVEPKPYGRSTKSQVSVAPELYDKTNR